MIYSLVYMQSMTFGIRHMPQTSRNKSVLVKLPVYFIVY